MTTSMEHVGLVEIFRSHPQLVPQLLGPAEIPTITDPKVGVANPQLAVLSALAHGNEPEVGLPVLRAAVAALDAFDNRDAKIYLHLIHRALDEPMRRALREETMLSDHFPDLDIYKLDLPQFVYEAVELGTARGEARALLKILDHRGVTLTPEQRETIASCQDAGRIEAWLERSFTARTASELFAGS